MVVRLEVRVSTKWHKKVYYHITPITMLQVRNNRKIFRIYIAFINYMIKQTNVGGRLR